MNGSSTVTPGNASRMTRPPPPGPAPSSIPPTPNHNSRINPSLQQHIHPPNVNGTHRHHHPPQQKGKEKNETQVDPEAVESVINRIAALEEVKFHEKEEERRFGDEARNSLRGMEEKTIRTKYIDLFADLKKLERDHAKEKQKLVKDKDAAKSQLTKVNQTKTKMENLARELQKDNKKLREDGKRLAQCVEDAQNELLQMKNDIAKRASKAKIQDAKYREMPDIVVKVVCRYRAELFFKISRKTKLSKLFNAWTDRMERTGGKKMDGKSISETNQATNDTNSANLAMQFIFTHNGRSVDADMTPEEVGMEDGDEILAVELMDLTENTTEEYQEVLEPHRQKLKKNWSDEPQEAKKTLEEIFDGVVRERLKEVLRQYELRERHFECVIRSKELEVLLSRARAAEQKQLAEGEKYRSAKQEEEINQLRKDLENAQNSQTLLIGKLLQYCKEILTEKSHNERTRRIFASLQEELERRAPSLNNRDGTVNGKKAPDNQQQSVGSSS